MTVNFHAGLNRHVSPLALAHKPLALARKPLALASCSSDRLQHSFESVLQDAEAWMRPGHADSNVPGQHTTSHPSCDITMI